MRVVLVQESSTAWFTKTLCATLLWRSVVLDFVAAPTWYIRVEIVAGIKKLLSGDVFNRVSGTSAILHVVFHC